MKTTFSIHNLLFFVYFIISLIFFFTFIGDFYYTNFVEDVSFSLDADSRKYLQIYESDYISDYPVFELSRNFLGPYLILKVFNANNFLIFLFNFLCLLCIKNLVFKYFNVSKNKFLAFLVLNPMVFFSLFTVNKEIIGILSIILLLCYTKERKIIFLIPALIFSLMTRWEYFAFCIGYLILVFLKKKLKLSNFKASAFLVFFLTVTLPQFASFFEEALVLLSAGTYSDNTEKFGFNNIFVDLQNKYLFAICLPFKILLNLYSPLYKIVFDIKSFYNIVPDFYNVFITTFCSVCYLIVMTIFIKGKYWKFNEDASKITFLSVIMIIIFSASPLQQLRYLLPTYVLFSIVICLKK